MLYDFKCNNCNITEERFIPLRFWNEPQFCEKCGNRLVKQFSPIVSKIFRPQHIDLLDEKENQVFVRSSDELKDALHRFNDSELGQKQGQMVVYDKTQKREV